MGISARFWSNLETQYRDGLARQQAEAELEVEADWADRFPIADLVRHRLIERGATKAATLANLLSWLGVSSPVAYDRVTSAAAYRASPAFAAWPEAVTAWLRWGELQAAEVDANRFDARRFRQFLAEIRPMTRMEPFAQVFKRVQEACAEVGVIVVLTPELSGTHISGAARWIGSKALIQLSLRHKSDDQFWFALFHEAGHLLSGGRRSEFIDVADMDDSEGEGEHAADRFARDTLLPPGDYASFVQAGDFRLSTVRTFARSQSIAAGIVAGRLEHDKHARPGQLRSLKKPLTLPSDHR